jgi:hypothetical protein
MWSKVRDANPNDTFLNELTGYFDAITKDMATVSGIPVATVSKENFDVLADSLHQVMNIPKSWSYDALTLNGTELLGASLGVLALALNWNKAETENFADIVGALGIASLVSANPLMALVVLVSLAHGYKASSEKRNVVGFLRGLSHGGIGTGLVLALSTLIGGPAWVGVVVGLCIAIAAKRQLKSISNVDICRWLVEQTVRLRNTPI